MQEAAKANEFHPAAFYVSENITRATDNTHVNIIPPVSGAKQHASRPACVNSQHLHTHIHPPRPLEGK